VFGRKKGKAPQEAAVEPEEEKQRGAYRTIIVFAEAVSLAYQYARLERKDGNFMLAEVLSLQEF